MTKHEPEHQFARAMREAGWARRKLRWCCPVCPEPNIWVSKYRREIDDADARKHWRREGTTPPPL